MTEAQKPLEPESEQTVEQDTVVPEPVQQPSEPSFARRAVRWLFRMLAAVLLGIALGAGIYYGARKGYREAIEPLQTLDQRMQDVESIVFDLDEALREDRNEITDELAAVQASLTTQAEKTDTLTAEMADLEARLQDQGEDLEQIDALRRTLDQIQRDLSSTSETVEVLQGLIEAGELPAERVEQLLQYMRVMNLMTRARLWIEQDNFGLASEDIEAALGILPSTDDETGELGQVDRQLLEIRNRLTLALETVRSNPALAEEELETVWKLLIEATAP